MWRGLASMVAVAALGVASPAAASAAVGSAAGVSPSASAWTAQATLLPAGATSGAFSSVSCTYKTSCIAVGVSYHGNHPGQRLAERWQGSAWSIISGGRRPAGASGVRLDAIACLSPTSCTAVGWYYNSAETQVPLAEHWNGTAWAIRATPSPAGATGSELIAVSCASDKSCVATGNATDTSDNSTPLAEYWNGTSWTIQPTPSPVSEDGSAFTAVSCTTATSCTAVGTYDPAEQEEPFAESWNGSGWTLQSMPGATGGYPAYVGALSCTSAASCIAVGWYDNPNDAQVGLAEHWNGSTWTISHPGGLNSEMNGVSCSSATSCITVGRHGLGASTGTYAAHWNGSHWQGQKTAAPTTGKQFAAISCTTASICTAVGSSIDASAPPLAEQR
jgi:hypothetical protein